MRNALFTLRSGYCVGCFRRDITLPLGPLLALCRLCVDELDDLQLRRSHVSAQIRSNRTYSVYRYEGLVRRLILRAKVQSDQRAAAALCQLLASAAVSQRLTSAPQAISAMIAAPSSLWSRGRGRLDLAAHLAETLAQAAAVPLLAPPWHLGWRLQKRALLPHHQRQRRSLVPRALVDRSQSRYAAKLAALAQPAQTAATGELPTPPGAPLTLLLVDDVVTTGATLAELAQALRSALTSLGGDRAFRLRRLTLATARTPS